LRRGVVPTFPQGTFAHGKLRPGSLQEPVNYCIRSVGMLLRSKPDGSGFGRELGQCTGHVPAAGKSVSGVYTTANFDSIKLCMTRKNLRVSVLFKLNSYFKPRMSAMAAIKGFTSFARFLSPFFCSISHLRDISIARHPMCAGSHLREFSTARLFNCATSYLRDIRSAQRPICATVFFFTV